MEEKMYTLATLTQLRQRLNLSAGAEDARLLMALKAASAQIERHAGRGFSPRRAQIDHTIDAQNPTELLLDDDLLQLISLADAGGTINLADVLALPGDESPGSVLIVTSGRAFTGALTPLRAVRVNGIWGWHDNTSQLWRSSGDTVRDNPLSNSATTLTVTDANAADGEAESPRFQVGHLLKIEDEYLRVTAVNLLTGDDTLTVQRGVNGTTAASHAQGMAISTYQPPADVVNLVLSWAAWVYQQPDFPPSEPLPESLLRGVALLRREGVKA
jgi:hypothetical protein